MANIAITANQIFYLNTDLNIQMCKQYSVQQHDFATKHLSFVF